jgi:hypothetical protein
MSIKNITQDKSAQVAVYGARDARGLPLFTRPVEDTEKPKPKEAKPSTQGEPKERQGLKLVHLSELLKNREPMKWLVKNRLPEVGQGTIYAPSGEGKTWLTVDLAGNVASGRDWLGAPTKRGVVAYLAGEGFHGIKERYAGWIKGNRGNPEMPLYISDKGGSLDTPSGLNEVLEALQSLPAPPVLVIVDTKARFMEGDENGTREAGLYVRACDMIRDTFQCFVLSVHHTGKDADRGPRGNSAFKGADDCLYKVQLKGIDGDSYITMKCEKMKDRVKPAPAHWKLETCVLDGWLDDDNEEVSSAYLVPEENIPHGESGRPRVDIPPDEIKKAVLKYPIAGKKELSGILSAQYNVTEKTAKARLDELEGGGVLIAHPGGKGGRTTYTIAPGHELEIKSNVNQREAE